MKILIAEDDLTSRMFMKKYLMQYGSCDLAMNGMEAIDMVAASMKDNNPYDLICLDIMMPKLDGIRTLSIIRELESESGNKNKKVSKIVMTTALNDQDSIEEAYRLGCEAYAWKPIEVEKFSEMLKELELI